MNILDVLIFLILLFILFGIGLTVGYITCERKYKDLVYNHKGPYPYGYCDQDCEACTNKCEIYELMRD